MGAESQAINQQGQSCQHPGMSRGFTVLDSHATSAYRVITLLTMQSDGHREWLKIKDISFCAHFCAYIHILSLICIFFSFNVCILLD
jgi:hypothetical protein